MRRVTTPTWPSHSGPGAVDGHRDLEAALAPSRASSSLVEQLVGRAPAVEQHAAARSARGCASSARIAGPQRRQADAAGDDDDVGALELARPARRRRTGRARRAPRPARAAQIACVARPTARTVCTSVVRLRGVAADRDRHLAAAAGREHRELARRERERAAAARLELERPGVGRLPALGARPRTARAPSARGRGAQPEPRVAVDVEELQPGRLQALDRGRGEALHQLVAELVVGLALAAQAQRRRTRRARTGSSARASNCQRYGSNSHDQPTTSPAPSVSITIAPRPGASISSATLPSRIR